jgi:hypothetical protein
MHDYQYGKQITPQTIRIAWFLPPLNNVIEISCMRVMSLFSDRQIGSVKDDSYVSK